MKRMVRCNYSAFASTIVKSDTTFDKLIAETARKIKLEMKKFSSDETDSLLRDTYEAVKHFSWRTVYLEMQRHLPTLVSLLAGIIPHSDLKEPLVCMVISQILKSRHQRMCLVQRAVSVMMYGNGCSKMVYYLV